MMGRWIGVTLLLMSIGGCVGVREPRYREHGRIMVILEERVLHACDVLPPPCYIRY